MAIYKRCTRCNKRILVGVSCSCRQKRFQEDKKYQAIHETLFYSSKEWSILRKQIIETFYGIDIYSYYMEDRIESGYTVHHIIPIQEDWSRRLDKNNLIYLTESNHRLIHNRMKEEKEATVKLLLDLIQRFKRDQGLLKKYSVKC